MESTDLDEVYTRFTENNEGVRLGKGVATLLSFDEEYYFVIDPEKHWTHNPGTVVTFSCMGGTVEDGESAVEALHREALEEIRSDVKVIDSPVTHYIDANGLVSKLYIEQLPRPFAIYEQFFENPLKGASAYLIYLFTAEPFHQPQPDSEIRAIFATHLTGFKRLKQGMALNAFCSSYKITGDMPSQGTIVPSVSAEFLLNTWEDRLDELMK